MMRKRTKRLTVDDDTKGSARGKRKAKGADEESMSNSKSMKGSVGVFGKKIPA